MSETRIVDAAAVESEVLERHLAWQQSMQAAVARNLGEHRQCGHAIVVMRNETIVSLTPDQY